MSGISLPLLLLCVDVTSASPNLNAMITDGAMTL
jgi:hypothetical protein